MSRRRRAEPREIPPDPQFNNQELSRFINRIMQRGKKTVAQRITYTAFDIIRDQSNLDPLEVFQQAMRNTTPLVEVKPKRIGGATYQVPTDLRKGRSEALAMRWLIRGAKARKGVPMRVGLAQELQEAARGEGSAVRRKEELHRMAEANRAFVHYRG